MQKVPLNEGGLEQNRQHSKSDRRTELSCFLALLDAAIPDTSPPFLKGNHAAETLPSNAKSTVSTTSERLRPHASAL